MAKTDFALRHAFRVRWSETDAQGIVFNGRILEYVDIGVTEYYRESGMFDAMKGQPFQTHAKAATIDWVKPILPDEMIEAFVRTSKIGTSSITQTVEIHGVTADDSDDLRATVDIVYVHVDLDSHTAMPVPEWARRTFAEFDAAAPAQKV